jgi:hypothetical protein
MRRQFRIGFTRGACFGIILSLMGIYNGAMVEFEAWRVAVGFSGITIICGLVAGIVAALFNEP